METLNSILDTIDGYVWGIPLIGIVLFVGILLTSRLGVLQVTNLANALRYMLHSEKEGEGEVSSFAALCTALAATVGTGNIVGVATAIGTGGPGALFWMEVAAFFGMATKYAEGLLAVKYRKVDTDGKVLGGPFYYIETGIKERFGLNFKWLAILFACFGVLTGLLGIGTITQVNGITSAGLTTPNVVWNTSSAAARKRLSSPTAGCTWPPCSSALTSPLVPCGRAPTSSTGSWLSRTSWHSFC